MAKIPIDLPNAEEVKEYIQAITADISDFKKVCDVSRTSLAQKLEGLSRVDIQNLMERAVKNEHKITMEKRLETLRRISESRDTLESRIKDLDAALREIKRQLEALRTMQHTINAPLPAQADPASALQAPQEAIV